MYIIWTRELLIIKYKIDRLYFIISLSCVSENEWIYHIRVYMYNMNIMVMFTFRLHYGDIPMVMRYIGFNLKIHKMRALSFWVVENNHKPTLHIKTDTYQ